MQTIPSASLVAYIRQSIQVDDAMEAPSLESVLYDVLASPVPAPDYRNALHANLPVEDATKALEVYSRWLTQHAERRSEGLAGWADDVKQTAGASGDIPTLNSVSFPSGPSASCSATECVSVLRQSEHELTLDRRPRVMPSRLPSPPLPLPS
jgi:hypothetical protein